MANGEFDAPNPLILVGDFSTGNFSQWTAHTAANPQRFAADRFQVLNAGPRPAGATYSGRCEVRPGDDGAGDGRNRCELQLATPGTRSRPSKTDIIGRHHYFRLFVYFPSPTAAGGAGEQGFPFNTATVDTNGSAITLDQQRYCLIYQYGVDGAPPTIGLDIVGAKIRLRKATAQQTNVVFTTLYEHPGNLVRDRWYEFIVHQRFDIKAATGTSENGGYVEMWMDDTGGLGSSRVKVLPRTNCVTVRSRTSPSGPFVEENGAYTLPGWHKTGMYRYRPTPITQVIRHAGWRLGETFASVTDGATAPGDSPPPAAGAPIVTSEAAASVGQSTATVPGTVDPEGASAVVTVEYGTTTSYGSSVAATPSPITGSSPTAVSAALTGLTADTLIHYRVKATNSVGTTVSADRTFRTAAVPAAGGGAGSGAVTYTVLRPTGDQSGGTWDSGGASKFSVLGRAWLDGAAIPSSSVVFGPSGALAQEVSYGTIDLAGKEVVSVEAVFAGRGGRGHTASLRYGTTELAAVAFAATTAYETKKALYTGTLTQAQLDDIRTRHVAAVGTTVHPHAVIDYLIVGTRALVSGGGTTIANTTVPTVTGIPQRGQTLTASTLPAHWTPGAGLTFSWQWVRSADQDVEVIPGATAAAYQPTAVDVGRAVWPRVTATAADGSSLTIPAAPVLVTDPPPAETDSPWIVVQRRRDPLAVPVQAYSGAPEGNLAKPEGSLAVAADGVYYKKEGSEGPTGWSNLDQTAAKVAFTAAGGIIATNVQAAIQELDAEKAAAAHNHAAADISSGALATVRLGSGTADNTKFLRGDQTWAVPAGGGGSTVSPYKASVRAASPVNVNVASPGATHDGVPLTSGDRLFLPAQANPAQNGIYVYNGAASALTRASDADTAALLADALFVAVEQGQEHQDSLWELVTDNPVVVGTTPLRFTRVVPSYAEQGLQVSGVAGIAGKHLRPVGAKLESHPRHVAALSNVSALTSGQVRVSVLGMLRAGHSLGQLTLFAGTAPTGVANQWAGIARASDRQILAVSPSADGTTSPWAANAAKIFQFGTGGTPTAPTTLAPFTADKDELLLMFLMVQGTIGTILGVANANAAAWSSNPLNGQSSSGQTTPPAVGATLAAITAAGPSMYAVAA